MRTKTIAFILTLITLFVITASVTPGQTVVSDSGSSVTMGPYLRIQSITGTIKAADTVIAKSFDRRDYDSTFTVWYKFTSATDSVKCKLLFQGSGIADNWVTIGTLADSIKLETPGYYNYYFREKATRYRLVLIGLTGTGYTTQFNINAILRKE